MEFPRPGAVVLMFAFACTSKELLLVLKPRFAPLRFRSRTYDDRQEVLERHLSIPTQTGLPVRFRSRSAPRAKKSLAKQKNARFDRSKTS
jgi:hypothetical protein